MMNSICVMGRLVKDPEYSEAANGTEKAVFCLAVDRDRKAKTEEKYKTDYINCVAWGSTAGFIDRNFKKGKLCGVTGRLEINPYTDKSGEKRSFTQVRVESIYFGGDKSTGTKNEDAAPAAPEITESPFAMLDDDDGDLPF